MSLSVRRAWIEMINSKWQSIVIRVALRKESVDRNIILTKKLNGTPPSLSVRRAWIEILL